MYLHIVRCVMLSNLVMSLFGMPHAPWSLLQFQGSDVTYGFFKERVCQRRAVCPPSEGLEDSGGITIPLYWVRVLAACLPEHS